MFLTVSFFVGFASVYFNLINLIQRAFQFLISKANENTFSAGPERAYRENTNNNHFRYQEEDTASRRRAQDDFRDFRKDQGFEKEDSEEKARKYKEQAEEFKRKREKAEKEKRERARREAEERSRSSNSSYEKLLGLIPGYTKADLKKAYRKASSKYHPDKHPGASESKLKELQEMQARVNEAYEKLNFK